MASQGQLSQVMEGLECQVEDLVSISWSSLPQFWFLPPSMSSKLQLLHRMSPFSRHSLLVAVLVFGICWDNRWDKVPELPGLPKTR